jgi:hypothetical protein
MTAADDGLTDTAVPNDGQQGLFLNPTMDVSESLRTYALGLAVKGRGYESPSSTKNSDSNLSRA